MKVTAKEEKSHICDGQCVTTKKGQPLLFVQPAFTGSEYALFRLPCGVHTWIYHRSEIEIERQPQ